MAMGATTRRIAAFSDDATTLRDDAVAIEEPLEIRVCGRAVSVTMRTPGHDEALALGFLLTEGIIKSHADVVEATIRGGRSNTVDITLTDEAALGLPKLARSFYVASSCGICGKTSADAVRTAHGVDLDDDMTLEAALVVDLPRRLREHQDVFDTTGGLHAAGLFDAVGGAICVREDVGRHNAVDKIVGHAFLAKQLPLRGHVLVVSGRASFELVQKAAMANIPVLVAVGAPSSLAIDLAEDVNMTLIGFVRGNRFNVYAGEERVRGLGLHAAPSATTSGPSRS